jgi:hypothetical protein
VDLGDVLRDRQRLVALHDPEHDGVVGIPVTARGVGDRRIVERRDAPAAAGIGVAEFAVVDQDATPTEETPVDLGVGVGEELFPTLLDEQEEVGLVGAVVGVSGRVPGDQVVGGAQPDAAFAVGVLGERDVGQRVERIDELGAPDSPGPKNRMRSAMYQAWRASPWSTTSCNAADSSISPTVNCACRSTIAVRTSGASARSAAGASGAVGYRKTAPFAGTGAVESAPATGPSVFVAHAVRVSVPTIEQRCRSEAMTLCGW